MESAEPPPQRSLLDRLLRNREGHFRGLERAWILLTRLLALASLGFAPFSCCFWPLFVGLAASLLWISFTPWALEGDRRGFYGEVLPVLATGLPAWILGGAAISKPPPELQELPWVQGSPVGVEWVAGGAIIGAYLVFLVAVRVRLLARWRAEHAESDEEAAAVAAERLGRQADAEEPGSSE